MDGKFIDPIYEPRKAVTAGEIAEGIAKLAQEKLDIKNLRDMFAAKAMQGLTTEGEVCGDCAEDVADRVSELSYIYADSMLKARDNK